MVGAQMATLKDGQRQVRKFAEPPTQDQAAELLNVGTRSIQHAAVVRAIVLFQLSVEVDVAVPVL